MNHLWGFVAMRTAATPTAPREDASSTEPIRRGLGHIVIQSDPSAGARTPDLLFWKLGEHGAPDSRLAAVSFAFLSNPGAVTADQALLAKYRDAPGYPRAVSVVIGRKSDLPPDGLAKVDGVTVIFFDVEKWQVAQV